MPRKLYEFIEHTADICIKVKAANLKDLFKRTAAAMFEIIAPSAPKETPPRTKISLKQKADSREELFINWLNELLFLSATKELIFRDFIIHKLDADNLQATAYGRAIEDIKVDREIKAATYHNLEIKKIAGHWQARIVFDV